MQCPTCKNDVAAELAVDPHSAYPFCSRRCRLIDLGKWFDGEYQIDAERAEDAEVDHDVNGGERARDVDPFDTPRGDL